MKQIVKSFLMVAIMSVAVSGTLYAKPVEAVKARQVAQSFLWNVSHVEVSELLDVSVQTPWENFYVFNFDQAELQGFILVSADDCVIPILGYSLGEVFSMEKLPIHVRAWLQDYDNQIAWWKNQPAVWGEERQARLTPLQNWEWLLSGADYTEPQGISVAPLISTKWGQSPYYNILCPEDVSRQDGHFPTGCTATATAQIMKKWNHPSTGYGSNSYALNEEDTLTADFGSTTYAWNLMPIALTATTTADSVNAVATLMYHIGVATEMKYDTLGSGAEVAHSYLLAASPSDENALRNNFKYSSTLHHIYYADHSDIEWKNMLRNELENGRPVLYAGINDLNYKSRHAFVCDGYNDTTGLFHINWGWNGSQVDGHYAIGSLNPYQNVRHYNTRNHAVIGIEPNTSWGGTTTVTVSMNNTGFGTVTGGGVYAFGDTVTLEVHATAGKRFAGWSDGYKYNPRQFVACGGVVALTALFETVEGDTMTYCTGDNFLLGYGMNTVGADNYWGTRFPSSTLTAGHSLQEVQMYANHQGTYDVTVYLGGTSASNAVYTASFTVTANERNAWKIVPITTPVAVDGTEDLYVTFHNNDTTFPATATYYSGNDDAMLWGASFMTFTTNPKSSWMIRAIFSDTQGSGDAVTSFPYNETFENTETVPLWHFVNGSSTNLWAIGTATNNTSGGSRSLYISNDGGASNAYTANAATIVLAYRTMQFSQGNYQVDFDWKCDGESNYDYLRVALVPASVDLSYGTGWGTGALPSGYIPLDGNTKLNQQYSWTSRTEQIHFSEAGVYNLVFYWRNDNSVRNNPPAAIDNIHIEEIEGVACDTISDTLIVWDFEGDNGTGWTFMNGSYTNQWVVGTAVNNTVGGSHALYVSNDGGNTNAYNATSQSRVLAYKTLSLDADYYTISFDWRNVGERQYDYLRVALVPASVTLSTNSWTVSGLPSTSYIALDDGAQLNMRSGWTTQVSTVQVPTAGEYKLVFCWNNDNQAGDITPAAIDNIIFRHHTIIHQGNTISFCGTKPYNTHKGNGSTMYWGVCIPPADLEGSDYLQSVMLYTQQNSQNRHYTMNVYNGDCDVPTTLLFSREYTIDKSGVYINLPIDPALSIDHTHHLWVTFSNSEETYPATACQYTGSPKSCMLGSASGGWVPWNTQNPNQNYSWMIKCVTTTASESSCGVVTSLPFSEDFEDAGTSGCWHFFGNGVNQWVIDTAANNTVGGGHALYVSSDGGVTNSYLQQYGASETYAYRTFQLNAGEYNVSFDWKMQGVSGSNANDFMRVILVPTSFCLNCGIWSSYNLPSGVIALDGGTALCLSTTWTTRSTTVSIPSNGTYNLVFMWKNATYNGNSNPPPAIDNITLSSTQPPCNVTLEAPCTVDFENSQMDCVVNYLNGTQTTKWVVGTAVNNTPGGSRGLYISSNGGANNTVGLNGTSSVVTYLPVQLEAREYTVSFDLKGEGWPDDMLRAALVYDTVSLNANYSLWNEGSLPAGFIALGSVDLLGHASWTTLTSNVLVPVAGTYKLVFYWYNTYYYYSSYNAAAIDNIVFDTLLVDTISFCGDNAPLQDIHVNSSDFDWGIRFTPQQLARHSSLRGVMLYTDDDVFGEGSNDVVLNIYSGSASAPSTLLYSQTYTIGTFDGYKYLQIEPGITIDHTQHLWITFHRNASAYIYRCRGWGFTGCNWMKQGSSSWQSMGGNDYYWMIKAVVSYDDIPVNCDAVENYPYYEDFENSESYSCWTLVNGSYTNKWTVGAAANNTTGGSHALYISNDNGVSHAYNVNSSSTVMAYRAMHLDAGTYSFSFDWTGKGESNYDYMRAALIPSSVDFTAGEWGHGTLPSAYTSLDWNTQLNYQSGWISLATTVTIDATGEYNLVFYWHNDNSVGTNPPAAVDNISVVPIVDNEDVVIQGDTVSFCGDYNYTGRIGEDDNCYWGISFTPDDLAGFDSIVSVLLYTVDTGVYQITLSTGTLQQPTNTVYSSYYHVTDLAQGYKNFSIYPSQPIDHSQHLWVTIHSNGIPYPSAVCNYTGSTCSCWLSSDGLSWLPLINVYTGMQYSWMIKIVTRATCSTQSEEMVVACDSYTWHGTTYTSSGTDTYVTTNAAGCDSTVTLYLTINHSVTVFDTLVLTEADMPYIYRSHELPSAGDYSFHDVTREGCDSTTNLHVVVEPCGIDGVEAGSGVRVFPNPTNGEVTVYANGIVSVEVMDPNGRVLCQKMCGSKDSTNIDLSHLPADVYILRVTTQKGVIMGKVVRR